MTVVLGVLEYSLVYYQQQLIASGIRDAARYISRSANSAGDPCASGVWATARNIATTGVAAGGTARVTGWTSANVTVVCNAIANGNSFLGGFNGNIYVVEVSTAFTAPTFGAMGFLGQAVPTIRSTHRERMIGPG
jgi:Flp pilus assembly protein TadG